MRGRSFAILMLAAATTMAACARSPSDTSGESGQIPGRLVVARADASLFTVKPDGTDLVNLVTEQSGLVVIQPTWSPDGTRLVWTEVDHMSEVPQPSIVTSGPDGENIEKVLASVAPFYYHWSPTGDQVAFLGGGPGGSVDLGIRDGDLRILGGAQPYYFDWAPGGGTLLTHTNLENVGFLSTDGTAVGLERTEARFQAPQWSADGSKLVYAVGSPPAPGGVRTGLAQNNGQEIVVADPQGAVLHRVTAFTGVATFDLSPDGHQLAHSVTLDRDAFNFGPLIVTDLDSGDEATVSEQPVLAYQWNPAGDRLLYLAAEESIDHPQFRWFVWNGEISTRYAQATPTTAFATAYLPFWDQYARSHTLWAPDGSAFAYPGLNAEGDPTIWVQPIGDPDPDPLATGDVVFWSPN